LRETSAKSGGGRNSSMTRVQSQLALAPLSSDAERPSAAELTKANINPATGLATDYLNHFNEAVMLLDLVAAVPECLPDLMAWRPMSYQEHFAASTFKDRKLAVMAYDFANPAARRDLEHLTSAMTAILLATRDAMTTEGRDGQATDEAARAAALLRPLVAHAGAVINGRTTELGAVDALFKH
jgi:uncharacterized protein involved in copper resistance